MTATLSESKGASTEPGGISFSPNVSALLLTAATLLLWLLSAWPAWLLAGATGLAGLTVSAALCLVPGILAVMLIGWLGSQSSTLVLASSGIRLTFVMAGAIVARVRYSELGMREFYLWLILFYLLMLAMETWIVRRMQAAEGSRG